MSVYRKRVMLWAITAGTVTMACAPSKAATFAWNASSAEAWSNAANWSPSGPPTSADSIVTPTAFGDLRIDLASVEVVDWEYNSANNFQVLAFPVSAASLSISGTLTKAGAGRLQLRSSGGTDIDFSVGHIAATGGIIDLGSFNSSSNFVRSFAAGSASLIDTRFEINVQDGGTNESNIDGDLFLGGSTLLYLAQRVDTPVTLSVGSLSSIDDTPIIRTNSFGSASSQATIELNNASGTATFAGRIETSNSSGSANLMSVVKNGAGTQVFSGNGNVYNGGTTINEGTLLFNNTANSGSGSGAIAVNDGGTLGGTGILAPDDDHAITVAAGGTLAPGASIGTLTLDLGGTTGGLTMQAGAGFAFELAASGGDASTPGTSDVLAVQSASAGDVVFNDTVIDLLATGEAGWYKLFDTDLASGSTWNGLTLSGQQIVGGLSATNLGGGLSGSLLLGDGTTGDADDIYLVVVPEPASLLLITLGGILLAPIARRSHVGHDHDAHTQGIHAR